MRRILRFDHLLLKYRNVCPACDYDFRLRLPVIVPESRCPHNHDEDCAPGDCDQFALTTFFTARKRSLGQGNVFTRVVILFPDREPPWTETETPRTEIPVR